MAVQQALISNILGFTIHVVIVAAIIEIVVVMVVRQMVVAVPHQRFGSLFAHPWLVRSLDNDRPMCLIPV